MRIRLDQIAEEPFRWEESRSISVDSLERSELTDLSEVHWSGRLSRQFSGYLFEARLTYRQVLTCTRCLAPVESAVDEEIELAVEVGAPQPTIGEHELLASDLRTLTLDEEVLDTTPILMEQLQLNIPMKPLCRDDCAGLCPECGADRNTVRCGCADSAVDPRWEALRQLSEG